jgi:two-component system cell cycle sensor histidine kinase/response regulator CckA
MFKSIEIEKSVYPGPGKREKEISKDGRLKAIGVIAGGIAHDFNNLLRRIIGNIPLAITGRRRDGRTTGLIENMEKAVDDSKELSCRLLIFSEWVEPYKQLTRIESYIKVAFSFPLSSAHISIHFDFQDVLHPVDVDRIQINQVFYNLAINAKEAMPDGGTLTVRAKNAYLTPKDNLPLREGRYIQISINDQGTGIPEDDLSKIFDPCFTTKETGTENRRGLGLAICHAIIKKHEGLITVESEPGKGSTFTVYLPSRERGEAEPAKWSA